MYTYYSWLQYSISIVTVYQPVHDLLLSLQVMEIKQLLMLTDNNIIEASFICLKN